MEQEKVRVTRLEHIVEKDIHEKLNDSHTDKPPFFSFFSIKVEKKLNTIIK